MLGELHQFVSMNPDEALKLEKQRGEIVLAERRNLAQVAALDKEFGMEGILSLAMNPIGELIRQGDIAAVEAINKTLYPDNSDQEVTPIPEITNMQVGQNRS